MKNKYFRYVAISVATALLAVATNAATVKLSDYATPNDGLNDSVGMQAAIEVLKTAGGGTLIVDDGIWDLYSRVSMTTYQNYVSFHIRGDKGAVIRPHLQSWDVLFYPGNTNHFTMSDIIITGDPNVGYDAAAIVFAYYTTQVRIVDCQFLGLRAADSIVHLGIATEGVIESSIFSGNAANVASIRCLNCRGLKVRDLEMFDYANFRNVYHSKSPNNAGPWIAAESTFPDTVNANAGPFLRVTDVRFDEASPRAISAKNIRFVDISGIFVNVSGITGGTGIYLDDVRQANVEMSSFGYTANARPAITAVNGTKVLTNGVKLGGGVYFGQTDSTSSIFFDERFCPDCTVRRLGQGGNGTK